MTRIRIQILHAAAQQKQLQRLLGESLRRRARRKRPVGPLGLALAWLVRHHDARIRIAAEITNEGRRTQVYPLQGLGAVYLFKQRELRQQRFKLRACEPPRDTPHASGQLQAPRMFRRGLQQPLKTPAQVRRATNVRLVFCVGTIQRENRRALRQLGQRGLRVSRVEGDRLHRLHVTLPRWSCRRCAVSAQLPTRETPGHFQSPSHCATSRQDSPQW